LQHLHLFQRDQALDIMRSSFFSGESSISMMSGRSCGRRRILVACRWLEWPKPIGAAHDSCAGKMHLARLEHDRLVQRTMSELWPRVPVNSGHETVSGLAADCYEAAMAMRRCTRAMWLPDPTELLARTPVVPVLTIERLADAVPLAQTLVAGGLPVLEVTLRTPVALDAVKAIVSEVAQSIVGIGTVTEVPQIRLALSAGAKFLVSPGTPPPLAAALAQAPVPVLPGCATISEAMALAAHGFPVVKFFPAEAAGGPTFLKAIAALLPDLKFCPTGGIDQRNASTYLALPNVVAVGGSWVAPKEAVETGDFARITTLAREAAALRQ
jgi:2-dehydro-3-deoxyphosphogluconate aldolase/(4S)-4-hydroxy-2-oxoglutarate aldolase